MQRSRRLIFARCATEEGLKVTQQPPVPAKTRVGPMTGRNAYPPVT